MLSPPTPRLCVAPIQFLCHDYTPIRLPSLNIEGGTAFLFQVDGRRYLITALHVWEGMLELSRGNQARQHGAFVYAGAFFPMRRDDPVVFQDPTLDVIVMRPQWLTRDVHALDFFQGCTTSVTANMPLAVWGFPGAKRQVNPELGTVQCGIGTLEGFATQPCNGQFRFTTNTQYELGGFSGAPVFSSNGTLAGIVSQGSSQYGIVTCSEFSSLMSQFFTK